MNDDLLDRAATEKVVQRAMGSALAAFFGAGAALVVPLSSYVVLAFQLVALVVGISAVRTLNHPDARVVGGVRHLGIVLAALGAALAVVGAAIRVYALVRGAG